VTRRFQARPQVDPVEDPAWGCASVVAAALLVLLILAGSVRWMG
jgi:hypothetical protein